MAVNDTTDPAPAGTDHCHRLVSHLAWADRKVLETLRTERPEPKAVEMLAHILAAEHVWLARLEGRTPTVAVWPVLTLDQCAALAEENRTGLTRYLTALRPEQLHQAVTYTNSAGQTFSSTVEDILLHVCLHGAYHRGQVMTMLRTAGLGTVSADYIAFIRGAATASRSPR